MVDQKLHNRYFVQSLARGLTALKTLAQAGRPLTLSELAAEMGINTTTATRLCYTLSAMDFIEKDGQKNYHLTPQILTLGYSSISGLDWRDVAEHYLRRLFEEVNETVNLAILDGSEILYLIRLRREKYLPFDIRIGTKLPVHCTGMGKVLMAMGQPEKVQPILNELDFRPLTALTITDLSKFEKVLETIRETGYALNDEELSVGNRALGVPILDKNGFAAAGINIAVPTKRYTTREMEEKLLPPLLSTAAEITQAWRQLDSHVPAGDFS